MLALSITSANGTVTRWGADERDGRDIPQGLTFSTSIPGGFKDLSCGLLRDYTLDHPDQALFDTVRVYGPGNSTVWEGRMVQFPAQRGSSRTISPGAVGWNAHLRDDPSFREIYVDRDFGRWGGAGTQRRLNLLGLNYGANTDPSVVMDSASSALKTEITGAWTATSAPVAEGWYNAEGISLGSLYYAWTKGSTISAADANWTWDTALSSDDTLSAYDGSASLRGAGPGTGTLTATTTTRVFGVARVYYTTTAAGTDQQSYPIYWTCLAAYGTHGLTKRGTNSATDAQGFYASDVIANIVSRAAPLLTYSTGAGGSIESTSFVIPHLVFADATTAEDAISLVNGFHLYEWGVWENREFFWRAPDPDRLTWKARLADGAKIDLEGDSAENVYNGVYVTYTDPSGNRKTAGPPGSGADTTDSSLYDTSSDNPVNAHGIPKRWKRLDISQTTTSAGAVQIGAVYLNELNLPSRRGTITITGTVTHPTKGKRPVWEMRAGDYVQLTDRPDDPVRRIIETRYDHDSLTITLSCDNTVFKLDALLERIGAGLIGF